MLDVSREATYIPGAFQVNESEEGGTMLLQALVVSVLALVAMLLLAWFAYVERER